MIKDTIKRIEEKLAQSSIREERRNELQALLAELREEVAALAESDKEKAESIAGFTQVSAHEATRSEPDHGLLEHSVQGLADSVKDFEASHPRLFGVVNAICHRLSDLGI